MVCHAKRNNPCLMSHVTLRDRHASRCITTKSDSSTSIFFLFVKRLLICPMALLIEFSQPSVFAYFSSTVECGKRFTREPGELDMTGRQRKAKFPRGWGRTSPVVLHPRGHFARFLTRSFTLKNIAGFHCRAIKN